MNGSARIHTSRHAHLHTSLILPLDQNWGSWAAFDCHLGLALPKLPNSGLWWGQGAKGRSAVVVLQLNNFFLKKTGRIYRIGPQKGSFQGCSGSRPCAEQRKTCIGGDSWVSRGSIAHAYRPWYLPICGSRCDGARQNAKSGPNIASFNDHTHVLC